MLPSLQESLDGDEKELESSEEGGAAEERRLEPPPSSHYCLYSYRGSRCSARPRRGPAPPRPRRSGCSPTPSSPRAEVFGPEGPSRPAPSFPAPIRDSSARCCDGPAISSAPPRRRVLCWAQGPACMSRNVRFHPVLPAVIAPLSSMSPPVILRPGCLLPSARRLSWAVVAL